mgnify:CR=1 FL=1
MLGESFCEQYLFTFNDKAINRFLQFNIAERFKNG